MSRLTNSEKADARSEGITDEAEVLERKFKDLPSWRYKFETGESRLNIL
jgi:hypothetical protein